MTILFIFCYFVCAFGHCSYHRTAVLCTHKLVAIFWAHSRVAFTRYMSHGEARVTGVGCEAVNG